MESGGRPCEDAPENMQRAVGLHSRQTLTAETENSTHSFLQISHQREDGDETVTENVYQGLPSRRPRLRFRRPQPAAQATSTSAQCSRVAPTLWRRFTTSATRG
jgi:hypothetical protein